MTSAWHFLSPSWTFRARVQAGRCLRTAGFSGVPVRGAVIAALKVRPGRKVCQSVGAPEGGRHGGATRGLRCLGRQVKAVHSDHLDAEFIRVDSEEVVGADLIRVQSPRDRFSGGTGTRRRARTPAIEAPSARGSPVRQHPHAPVPAQHYGGHRREHIGRGTFRVYQGVVESLAPIGGVAASAAGYVVLAPRSHIRGGQPPCRDRTTGQCAAGGVLSSSSRTWVSRPSASAIVLPPASTKAEAAKTTLSRRLTAADARVSPMRLPARPARISSRLPSGPCTSAVTESCSVKSSLSMVLHVSVVLIELPLSSTPPPRGRIRVHGIHRDGPAPTPRSPQTRCSARDDSRRPTACLREGPRSSTGR